MAFTRIERQSGDRFIKWDVPKTVVARFVGFQAGQYKGKATRNLVLEGQDGVRRQASLVTVLESDFAQVPVGSIVEIPYQGVSESQAGVKFKQFGQVGVDTVWPDGTTPLAVVPEQPQHGVAGTTNEYDALAAKLRIATGARAEGTLNALSQLYAEGEPRLAALRQMLAKEGVA